MSAGYAPAKPHFELLEVLASIAAFQDSKYAAQGKRWGKAGAWCIVRQGVIRGWYERLFKRYERPAGELSRRTLQYHLAALKRSGHLRTVERHTTEPRSRKLKLRPSLYVFTARGRQWISRRAGWVENPAALLAAQKIAQSGFNPDPYSSTSLSRAVDKASTARHGKTAKLRAQARSTIAGELPGKALSRGEGGDRPRGSQRSKGASGRAQEAATPRKRRRTARRTSD